MLEERTDQIPATSQEARPDTERRHPWLGWRIAAIIVVLVIGVAAVAQLAKTAPGDRSAEVGFARDMATHHAQAVALATLVRDRADDPELRQLALDIMLTQQAQIGQMHGWLAVWGQPIASATPAMDWMGMPTTGPMPGMASAADLNRLRDLEGHEAEVLFLRLMIPHHQSGVTMAQAILERSQRPEVRALAQSIVDGQQAEIRLMQEALAHRDNPPVPDAPADHGNATRHEGGTGTPTAQP